jgi:hypothetical protein
VQLGRFDRARRLRGDNIEISRLPRILLPSRPWPPRTQRRKAPGRCTVPLLGVKDRARVAKRWRPSVQGDRHFRRRFARMTHGCVDGWVARSGYHKDWAISGLAFASAFGGTIPSGQALKIVSAARHDPRFATFLSRSARRFDPTRFRYLGSPISSSCPITWHRSRSGRYRDIRTTGIFAFEWLSNRPGLLFWKAHIAHRGDHPIMRKPRAPACRGTRVMNDNFFVATFRTLG